MLMLSIISLCRNKLGYVKVCFLCHELCVHIIGESLVYIDRDNKNL